MSDNYYFITMGAPLLVLKKKKQKQKIKEKQRKTNKQKNKKTNNKKDALGTCRVTCRLNSCMMRPPIFLLLISSLVACIVHNYKFVSGPETPR